jgi:preprotein translocase subunit YajC
MDFFTREAWAQDSGLQGGGTTDMLVQFGPLILIFGIFYFLIIRPQQKRQKESRAMLSALGKGDKVVTNSGIHGTIFKLGDDTITLEIADKVRVQMDRGQVARVAQKIKDSSSSENDSKEES